MSGFMAALITLIHIAACISLVVAILLQSGKGGGLAGAFGAGSSQTLFGGRGAATFLSRAATTLAVVFFLTSLTLGLASVRHGTAGARSLIQEEAKRRAEQRGTEQAPTSPGPGAPAPGQGLGQSPAPIAPGSTTPGAPAGPSAPTQGPTSPNTSKTAPPQTPAPPGPQAPQGSGSK